eukprot:scaffold600_cov189-Amphora_coffeaeformis.AAC.4
MFVHILVASKIIGLEELYTSVICEHCGWATQGILQSQHDRALRNKVSSIVAMVSTQSKNFARLVALGDVEEAKKVSTTHGA